MNDIHPIVGASSPPNFYRTFLPSSENLTAFEELRDACSFYNKHEGLDDWHFQNLFAARQAKRGNGAVVMEEGEVEGTNGDWQEDMDIDSAIGNGRKVETDEKENGELEENGDDEDLEEKIQNRSERKEKETKEERRARKEEERKEKEERRDKEHKKDNKKDKDREHKRDREKDEKKKDSRHRDE